MVGNLLYDNTRYVYTAINTFRNFIVSKRKNVVHLCMVGKKSWSCLWTPNIGGNFLSLIIFPIMAVLTRQIPNSHYEKNALKTGKNFLVLSKSLLVTIAITEILCESKSIQH